MQHINQQITVLDTQKLALEQQQQQQNILNAKKIPPLMPPGADDIMNMNPNNVTLSLNGNSMPNQPGNNFGPNDRNKNNKPPPLMSQNISMPSLMAGPPPMRKPFDNDNNFVGPNSDVRPSMPQQLFNSMGDGMRQQGPNAPLNNFQNPPPNFNINLPDLSRPPPGFCAPPIQQNILPLLPELVTQTPPLEDPKPKAPYYDLPAGLMVPLIRLEDCSYKQLDPDDIRLPAPAPPSERLLAAIDAFYAPPSHDRPRDGYAKLLQIQFGD